MTILFDPEDDYVRSILDRAARRGEISLANLESIIRRGKDGQITPNEADIADTIDALAGMGIEIELVSRVRPAGHAQLAEERRNRGNPAATRRGALSARLAPQIRSLHDCTRLACR